jgi:hypothetical protein
MTLTLITISVLVGAVLLLLIEAAILALLFASEWRER